MDNRFSINMTSLEARAAFFAAADEMSREDWERLYHREFVPVFDIIIKRELEMGYQGALL